MKSPSLLVCLACLALVACSARPPIPSLVVGFRTTRSVDDARPAVDRGFNVGLVATERPPARIPATTPPQAPRAATTRCDAGWLCAWERTRVAEASARLAGVLR